MNPLRVSPLPTTRAQDECVSLMMEREGFVDESMVAAMMRHQHFPARVVPYPEDLALAADDLDFAGWKLSPPSIVRVVEKTSARQTPHRRPAPPVVEESGLGSPHSGTHRWWFAGLAGVLSTMLFSILLLSLSTRAGTSFEFLSVPTTSASPTPASERIPQKVTSELTDISAHQP